MNKTGIMFDKNNIRLISSFLKLKDYCYYFEKYFLGEGFHQTNLNKLSFVHYASFYSSFADVCDLPIFFLINEEISNEHKRDFAYSILTEALASENFKGVYDGRENDVSNKNSIHIQEIRHLLSKKYNPIVGSMMLDFSVSSFSVFEYWIDHFYNMLCQNHREKIIESRKDKKRKIIEKYKDDLDSCIDKISKIPGDFISFPDKLNGVLDFVNKENYKRDLEHDKKIIEFLGKRRNAVHNLGIHRGQDCELINKDIKFRLEKNKPAACDSWANCLDLTGELIKIYTAILSSMDSKTVESFVDPRIDYRMVGILKESIDHCFVFPDPRDDGMPIEMFKKMLINKFGFNEDKANKFIENIQINMENLDFSDLGGVLALSAMKL